MSTIVLDNLRQAFPAAAIDFLTEAGPAEIVAGHPALRRVLIWQRSTRPGQSQLAWLAAAISFLLSLRHEGYDLVFDFFGNPRSALITLCSGARQRVGYNYRIRQWAYNLVVPSRASELHEADWHLDALTQLQIPITSRRLHVAIAREDKVFAEQFLAQHGWPERRVVAINFSGGWPAKRWPLQRFAELAEAIAQKYPVKLMALWGPGERAEAERLVRLAQAVIVLAPATTLKQAAALLQSSAVLVSTDSGPMHMAAALGTPCVAIFGPTNPDLQGPMAAGIRWCDRKLYPVWPATA